jgi:hypothetical protein
MKYVAIGWASVLMGASLVACTSDMSGLFDGRTAKADAGGASEEGTGGSSSGGSGGGGESQGDAANAGGGSAHQNASGGAAGSGGETGGAAGGNGGSTGSNGGSAGSGGQGADVGAAGSGGSISSDPPIPLQCGTIFVYEGHPCFDREAGQEWCSPTDALIYQCQVDNATGPFDPNIAHWRTTQKRCICTGGFIDHTTPDNAWIKTNRTCSCAGGLFSYDASAQVTCGTKWIYEGHSCKGDPSTRTFGAGADVGDEWCSPNDGMVYRCE